MPSKAKVKVTKVRTTTTAKVGKSRNRTGFSCPYFFEIFYKNVLTNIEKYVII